MHLRECYFVMKKINIILFTHAYTFNIIMKIQHDCTVVHELQNTQQALREGATWHKAYFVHSCLKQVFHITSYM